MLRPVVHPVACCCAKFETGQTFEETTPNISFVPYSPKRSAAMLDPFTQLEATHAAHYTWSPWSLQSFMGCILPRPTAGPNNVGSCCICLHVA